MESGEWRALRTECRGDRPDQAEDAPSVTPGAVLSALRRIGLPELETQVQPDGRTLVHFDTVFHTTPEPVSLPLSILGQAVDVVATPEQYRWDFGDGTTRTTATPGAPYPDQTITHRYQHTGQVAPHVQTTYRATFRVNGGPWQTIAETVTTHGPATPLEVTEGTPLLADRPR